eukprot:2907450-Lingulodinium_polyedra.AAC.1
MFLRGVWAARAGFCAAGPVARPLPGGPVVRGRFPRFGSPGQAGRPIILPAKCWPRQQVVVAHLPVGRASI